MKPFLRPTMLASVAWLAACGASHAQLVDSRPTSNIPTCGFVDPGAIPALTAAGVPLVAEPFGTFRQFDPAALPNAPGNGATAVSLGSTALGDQSLAMGQGSLAFSFQSLAAGYCATAFGQNAVALGGSSFGIYSTAVSGRVVGDMSVAFNGQVVGNSSAAIGGIVYGDKSMALGGAVLANSSVAIGSDSAATEDYTVSFGNPFTVQRRLTNLSDGIAPSDAATIRQLDQVRTSADAALVLGRANGARLDVHDAVLLQHDQRITTAQTTADAALVLGQSNSSRLDVHDAELVQHDRRITAAQSTADAALSIGTENSQRLDVHEQGLVAHQALIRQNIEQIEETKAGLNALNRRVDVIDRRLAVVEGEVNHLGLRMKNVEQTLDHYRAEARAGTAAAAAMNLPTPSLSSGERALVLGVGSYKGESALAAGLLFAPRHGTLVTLRLGSSRLGTAVSAGGSWKF